VKSLCNKPRFFGFHTGNPENTTIRTQPPLANISQRSAGIQPDPRALCATQCRVVVISDMVLHYPLHGGLYSKTKCGFHSPAGAHTPPAPVREETKNLKENARRERCSTQSSTGREWMPQGAGNGESAIHGGAESAVAALLGASGVKMMKWSALYIERWGGLSMRMSAHEVHQAARASRGRSGAPKVRVCTRLACGLSGLGQLGGSLPGSEVDYTVAC
jgi:hypothetical protein